MIIPRWRSLQKTPRVSDLRGFRLVNIPTYQEGCAPQLHRNRSCFMQNPCKPCPMHLFMELFISILYHNIYSIQLNHSMLSDSVTPWTTACQASLFITNSQWFLKLVCIKSAMPSNLLILCHPLLLLTSMFPIFRDFSNESVLLSQSIGASALASVLSMNIQDQFPLGWTGLISLQSKELSSILSNTREVSKESIFWRSAFLIAPLLYPYMTTGKKKKKKT